MLANLLKKASGRRTGLAAAKVHTLPSPVGGWNARDALSAMKPDDAIILDNIIPGQGKVFLRPGYQTWTTGIAGEVETLMEYAPPDATNTRLFGAGPDAIYDVTASGALGAAVQTGLTSARWQHVMFANTAGTHLCAVNGVDHYRTFNGTAWVDQHATTTGVDTTDLVGVAVHAKRLWFVERNSLDAWYLDVEAITGAAHRLPLGALCKRGSTLLAIASWTKDSGDGMDDLWVGVTTKGEVIVYSGTNPDNADTWQLVGVFTIAEPVGRRCLIKVGGDLGIITSTGVALLSQLIAANKSGQSKLAITNKISGAFQDAYRLCGTSHGWQIIEFPKQSLVIVNVPVQERVRAHQYVINIATGAWCRWSGINANCWSLMGDRLFFGASNGRVYEFGDAQSDDGLPINWTVQLAFNKCGGPNNKIFKMARALMMAAPGYRPGVGIKVDYDTSLPAIEPPSIDGFNIGALWDEAIWDEAEWASSAVVAADWQTIEGAGRAVSVCLAGSAAEVVYELNEIDILYEAGGWL